MGGGARRTGLSGLRSRLRRRRFHDGRGIELPEAFSRPAHLSAQRFTGGRYPTLGCRDGHGSERSDAERSKQKIGGRFAVLSLRLLEVALKCGAARIAEVVSSARDHVRGLHALDDRCRAACGVLSDSSGHFRDGPDDIIVLTKSGERQQAFSDGLGAAPLRVDGVQPGIGSRVKRLIASIEAANQKVADGVDDRSASCPVFFVLTLGLVGLCRGCDQPVRRLLGIEGRLRSWLR